MGRRQVTTVAMCLTLAALGSGPAKASTIYLQFSSGAANGNVAGIPFGDALWSMEFAVNNATPDSSGAPWLGRYLGAITQATIKIDNTVYQLTGASASGDLFLDDYTKEGLHGARINVNPTSGGFLEFITGDNVAFPQVFTNNDELTTAIFGVTVSDHSTDSFHDGSQINFTSSQPLLALGGPIAISEVTSANSGEFRFKVSDTSEFAPVPTPEPSSMVLFLIGAAPFFEAARRRASFTRRRA
jgi:hypothetical protein